MRILFNLLIACLLGMVTFVEWVFPSLEEPIEKFFREVDDQIAIY